MLLMPLGERHQDERGVIQDLLTEGLDSATLIGTKKGAVRGNHYHRHTTQWVYVVIGALRVLTRDPASRRVRETIVGDGKLMMNPPLEEHAWQALEETVVLVLTRGPRSGPDYESDTYRLEVPLTKEWRDEQLAKEYVRDPDAFNDPAGSLRPPRR